MVNAGRSKACGTCKRRWKGVQLSPQTVREIADESSAIYADLYALSVNEEVFFAPGSRPHNATPEHKREVPTDCYIETFVDVPDSIRASTLTYLYMGQSWSSMMGPSRRQPAYGWILSLADIHGRDTGSNLALKALLFALNGHQLGNNDMAIASYRMYNSALSAVAQRCRRDKDAVDDDTLAAVLLLALYEIMQGSSNRVSSWINHTGGAYTLVQKRGPSIQNTYNGKALFRDFRMHGIIYAIGRRKTSFLSKLSWLGDPFQDAVKSEKDYLLDIMATFPSILEIADDLIAEFDLDRSLSLMYDMRIAYAKITLRLAHWRGDFQAKRNVGSQWYQNASLFTRPRERHLLAMFPFALFFPDIETAELDMLYWTAAIILHSNFYLLLHHAQDSPLAALSIPNGFPHLNPGQESYFYEDLFDPLETECNMRIFVNNIAESLEYFLQPDIGVLAINSIVFPMALAMAFLDFFQDPRLEYFLAVADKVEERYGVPLRDFLQNIPNQNILRLVKTAK